MNLPAQTVLLCDENEIRADLYALWLDELETETALTESQVDEKIDGSVAVAVVDQSFSRNDAETVLDLVESRAPQCRTVGTRDRSTAFPQSGFDDDLIRPVFEDDLVECVKSLFCQANYEPLLKHYYRTTVAMSSLEWQTEDGDIDDERYDRLRVRVGRIKRMLKHLRAHMTDEDVRSVMRSVSISDIEGLDSAEAIDSKYRPSGCSNCGQDWSELIDGAEPTKRLGAFVWRCVNCGHVQMYADPSHRRIGSYR